MKRKTSEQLSDQLSRIDENLLDEAFAVDTADKLKKYKEAGHKKDSRRPVFRGVIVAAACLALIVGIWLAVEREPGANIHVVPTQTVPSQIQPPQTTPTLPPPQIFPENPVEPTLAPEGFKIRNIDMLNYYSAVQVLLENTAKTASFGNGYTLSKLNKTEETLPADTEGPPLQPPTEPTVPEGGYEKYYYTFEPGMIFYVTRVMFFQIELTNPDGFLASQVGCGVVDVVITNNSIGDMITFKNGDRFYSCIVNGQGQMYMEFSTHIYVEGFAVVKNTDPESYRFTVTFDGNQITGQPQVIGMEIGPFEAGSHPDGVARVVSQTYIKEMLAVFNVEKLEEFFKNGILPEGLL